MLYLLRHGETEWSRIRRKQGRADSPLTALGLRQARACGSALKSAITASSDVVIYSSPLGRAQATAEVIRSSLALPNVLVEDCLAELDYGEWSGLIDEEIDQRYPGARVEREGNKWNYMIPGGESYAQLDRRLRPWVALQREQQFSIVVAHEMVSRVLRGIYQILEPARVLQLNHPHTRIYLFSGGAVSHIDAE